MTAAPPYSRSPALVSLVAEIGEALGAVAMGRGALRLRRVRRVRTLHGTLAIEGNSLGEGEIRTILEGRPVVAPPREIQEVRNAIRTYDVLPDWEPSDEQHLLRAHATLMEGLVDTPGVYRTGPVGVIGSSKVLHVAPPAHLVAHLMGELFAWLRDTEEHPLVSAAVFHYELEFIHPFADGNGRMGRLWQTLILSRWRPAMAELPVESIVHQRQQAYYDVLARCGAAGDSTAFVEFILEAILAALRETDHDGDYESDHVDDRLAPLLAALAGGPRSATELMAVLGLRHRPSFRQRYLRPALERGWIEMTHPETPRSRSQRYRLVCRT